MSVVDVQFLNGGKAILDHCRTVNGVQVQVAGSRDVFAPDVCVMSTDQAKVLSADDVPPPAVSVVITEEPYDRDRWCDALASHAKAGDKQGVGRAVVKMERDGHPSGVLLGKAVLNLVCSGSADASCISTLIASRADVNYGDEYYGRPIDVAVDRGSAQIVQLMVAAAADLHKAREEDETPLFRAALGNKLEIAEILIAAYPGGNRSQIFGDALHGAAISDQAEMAQLLVIASADVSYVRPKDDERTALHSAAFQGSTKVAQILLTAGAGTTCEDEFAFTALSQAGYSGHAALVQVLINAGADVNHVDSRGNTGLFWAAHKGHAEVVEVLLSAHADVHHREYDFKRTALQDAQREGHDEVVKLLVAAGAGEDGLDNEEN